MPQLRSQAHCVPWFAPATPIQRSTRSGPTCVAYQRLLKPPMLQPRIATLVFGGPA
jgi:hypothetical protein